MKTLFLALAALSISASAFAQNKGDASNTASGSGVGTTTGTLEGNPWDTQPSIVGGVKSYSDFGRQSEQTDPKSGRLVKSKNEFYLGAKSKSGWGAYAMGVEYGYAINENPVNGKHSGFTQGDPSFSILHPVYDDGKVKITGQFKQYFPVSDFSVSKNIWEQTYYSVLLWKMPRRFDFSNVLIPRYFSARNYAPGDTNFYTEDYTQVTYPVAKWMRVGLGQHYQVEVHAATPVGQTLEVFPMADFIIAPGVFAGPRVFFPVAVQNSVFDAPKSVNLNQAQPELYIQATL